MNGILVLDKPQRFTSFDAVAVLRGICRTKKIGHTGTLDPMATGVLPILIGSATRAAELLPETGKAYRASFRLGLRTDTQDIWGTVQEQRAFAVDAAALEQACVPLRGAIMQVPPMMSALKQNGVRLYDLARQGIEVAREPRPVTVEELTVACFCPETGEGELTVRCSKGTYIRTLIADLGEALGCGAVMTALRRTAACGFTLSDARTLEELQALADAGRLTEQLRPVESLFDTLPTVQVTANQATRFLNGGALALDRLPVHTAPDGALYRVHGAASGAACRFLGLGVVHGEAHELAVRRLFPEPPTG